ncbi:MAG: immunoglobulin domain-containing protein [Saprospiraceae bacterium]|nr:immunoglobulin domain-containing protein [Saprospiraceae bacterium]
MKIENAEKSDTGNYYCHITGICNELNSDTLELKIVLPTKIVSQPSPLKICAGETATFTILAEGDNLKYQWKKDEVTLAGANQNTYKITTVKTSDSGSYTCSVSGAGGDLISNAALLTVNVKPEISVQPVSQNAAKGADAKFSVTATGTIETYQWFKDGVKLTNGLKYSGTTTSELKIVNVNEADKGSFNCVITGPCGSVTSANATLNVTSAVIDDLTEKIKIFPNPASDIINVEMSDFSIIELELKDNLGRIVKSIKNSEQINISGIQPGMYFLTIITKETKIVKKIIISR